MASIQPGTLFHFLPGTYSDFNLYLQDEDGHSGTESQPVVFHGEPGVVLNCAAGSSSQRASCFNLERADYVVVDGFEMIGGKYGVRAVGSGYGVAAAQIGVVITNNDVHDQSHDPIFTGNSSYLVVENNKAHGAGAGDGHGIYLSNGGDYNIIRFNELWDNSGAGFQINADPISTCSDVGIAYNDPSCDGAVEVGLGQGIAEYILVEGNYFHDDNVTANFTSVRKSVVRNNTFGPASRHGVSFWQETDNPKLGSTQNLIDQNLFLNNSSGRHAVQFINDSDKNTFTNNIVLCLNHSGSAGSNDRIGMEMDGSTVNSQTNFSGNYYVSCGFDGYTPNAQETQLEYASGWFVDAPWGDIGEPEDYTLTGAAPFDLPADSLPPQVSIEGGSRTITDGDGLAGEVVNFIATASDSDGTVVTTQWLVNAVVVATGLTPSIELPDGATVVTFRATDDDGAASTANVTITVQVPDAPQDDWPAPYNGITPDQALNLEFNNIGVYDPEDLLIYTCLRVFSNGDPADIDGIERFDIAFEIVSMEEGIIRVIRTRPFNEGSALNESGQEPSCSGYFETTLNTYEDIIQAGEQTLTTTFELFDPINLELRLLSVSEIQP